MRADLSGEWILNRQASTLQSGAAAVDSGVMWIDHRDPKCGFRMNMSAGGQSVEHTWESWSDGVEVAGGGVLSRLLWEVMLWYLTAARRAPMSLGLCRGATNFWKRASVSEQLNRYVVAAGIRTTFGSSSGGERRWMRTGVDNGRGTPIRYYLSVARTWSVALATLFNGEPGG
jgi:hypothetical protein